MRSIRARTLLLVLGLLSLSMSAISYKSYRDAQHEIEELFDAQLAQSAIADHAARSHQLVDLGATVAADLVEALTPDERRDLAQAIRQRIEEERQRRARRSR